MDDGAPAEQPHEEEHMPSRRTRRTRWIAGGAAAGLSVVVVGVAVAFSKKSVSMPVVKDVSIPSLAAKAVRHPLDHQVPVRQHVRRQPYGPNRSLRKVITIPGHFRGPKAA
jgi:hypothetical protein